jgi:hypothetical protein
LLSRARKLPRLDPRSKVLKSSAVKLAPAPSDEGRDLRWGRTMEDNQELGREELRA